jgi:hypothetical protein
MSFERSTRLGVAMVLLGAVVALGRDAQAQTVGSLGLPDTISGYPANVGFLILGHSTSAQGQYPQKLVAALNHASHTEDARHYVVFPAITGGDGGLLWSVVSTTASDSRHARVTASQGVGESAGPQWCEAGDGSRWSCRRGKVEHLLLGASPFPITGTCGDTSFLNNCRQPATMSCTWYDRSLPLASNPVTQALSPRECWLKMDIRIALIQDTSNRSWPIDDYTANGAVDDNDRWLSTRIAARAQPCPATSGVVAGQIDWNCDGAIDAADAAHRVYASWIADTATQLLDDARYGAATLDHVFVSIKPTEMGQCSLWPSTEIATCQAAPHAIRTPAQIAATPGRPHDHYFVPSVYWEYRAIEQLFATPSLDTRIHALTPGDARALWTRSAQCYTQGLADGDWHIPAAVPGRPVSVAADDSESDPSGNAATVGCMIADHIHHNDAGGWMMADQWFQGLAGPLWAAASEAVFADDFE